MKEYKNKHAKRLADAATTIEHHNADLIIRVKLFSGSYAWAKLVRI